MSAITLFLMIAALVFFVLAEFGTPSGRFNLVAAGLACWILTELLPHAPR